jgi:hypothetical protein
VPRWFQRTSRLSRRPIGGMCVLIFWTALRGSQNSSVALSQVMNHGFWSMKRVARVRPGIARTWMLHHDNASCYPYSLNTFQVSIHQIYTHCMASLNSNRGKVKGVRILGLPAKGTTNTTIWQIIMLQRVKLYCW